MITGNTIDVKSSFTTKEFMGHYSHLCLTSLEDSNLSIFAKGVHIYFITKPKNWIFRPSNIYKRLNISERSYQRALTELEEKGYLYRIHKNFHSWKYIRCDNPTNKKEVEKFVESGWSLQGCPTGTLGKGAPQAPLNKSINKKVLNNNILINSSKDEYDVAQEGQRQVPKKLLRRPNKQKISDSLKNQVKSVLKEPKVIAPKIKELLDYHSSTSHRYKPNSKAYFDSAKAIQSLMSGKLFNGLNSSFAKYKDKKFTYEEIKGVLSRIGIVATNPDYIPQDKSKVKMSFDKLAYNPFNDDPNFKSNFIYYFENEPKHCGNGVALMEDPYPLFTGTFKQFYQDCIVGGAKQNYTIVQENKFINATKKAYKFLNENKQRMHSLLNDREYALVIIDAVKDEYKDKLKNIEIGTFGSSRTWEKTVPSYFVDQGIMEPLMRM